MTKPRDADNVVDPVRVSARAWADFPGFYAELGNELSAAGKMQAAKECRQKAETLLTNLLTEPIQGPEQARTLAQVLNHLAWRMTTSADSKLRDGPTALRLAERAVVVTSRTNAIYLDTLAAAYAADGQFTNAVNVQEEAIEVLATGKEKEDYTLRLKLYLDGIPYRDTGSLATHALALLREGKFAEAEPMARECLALRERLIPDNALTFNARSLLGGSLVGQRKYAKAEPLLVSGYEGMKQREDQIPPGFRAIRLREAVQRLVELYEATGQSEKAAKYRQTLAETDKSEASNQSNTP